MITRFALVTLHDKSELYRRNYFSEKSESEIIYIIDKFNEVVDNVQVIYTNNNELCNLYTDFDNSFYVKSLKEKP